MSARVSSTEAVRAEIDELFGSGRDIAEILERVMCLSAPALHAVSPPRPPSRSLGPAHRAVALRQPGAGLWRHAAGTLGWSVHARRPPW